MGVGTGFGAATCVTTLESSSSAPARRSTVHAAVGQGLDAVLRRNDLHGDARLGAPQTDLSGAAVRPAAADAPASPGAKVFELDLSMNRAGGQAGGACMPQQAGPGGGGGGGGGGAAAPGGGVAAAELTGGGETMAGGDFNAAQMSMEMSSGVLAPPGSSLQTGAQELLGGIAGMSLQAGDSASVRGGREAQPTTEVELQARPAPTCPTRVCELPSFPLPLFPPHRVS